MRDGPWITFLPPQKTQKAVAAAPAAAAAAASCCCCCSRHAGMVVMLLPACYQHKVWATVVRNREGRLQDRIRPQCGLRGRTNAGRNVEAVCRKSSQNRPKSALRWGRKGGQSSRNGAKMEPKSSWGQPWGHLGDQSVQREPKRRGNLAFVRPGGAPLFAGCPQEVPKRPPKSKNSGK